MEKKVPREVIINTIIKSVKIFMQYSTMCIIQDGPFSVL